MNLTQHFGSQLNWRDGVFAGVALHATWCGMRQDYLGLDAYVLQVARTWVEFGPGLAALYTLSLAWFAFQVYARLEWHAFIVRAVRAEQERKK